MLLFSSMEPEVITGETCPICNAKELSLVEERLDVPYFGICYVFSMDCAACKYHKADIEAEKQQKAAKFTFEVGSEEDLRARVVKSSNATVKLGTLGSIEPGEASNGYITNIEGLLNRMKRQLESVRDAAQEEGDAATAKKAKNHLKKLTRVLWGQEVLKVSLKDPSGNSAIIHPKAEKK